ncbi:MAG: RNA methyltransferase, partial [Treponema sp.]|nr:RNA methyltransferase [Treponema sp.]
CRSIAEAGALWQDGSLWNGDGPAGVGHSRDGGSPGDRPVRKAFALYERSEGTLPVHRAVAAAVQAVLAAQGPAPQEAQAAQGTAAAPCGHLKNAPETADIAVMVGAEGGISPSELERAKDSGFIPVHLETNILRCETAALYGLAVLQNAVVESDLWKLKE